MPRAGYRQAIVSAVVLLACSALAAIPVSIEEVDTCTDAQIFDTSSSTCGTCLVAGEEPGSAALSAFAGAPTTCRCGPGLARTALEGEALLCTNDAEESGSCRSYECAACPASVNGTNVPTRDGLGCQVCGPSTRGASVSSETGDCRCPSVGEYLMVLSETDAGGRPNDGGKACNQCASGTVVVTVDQSVAGRAYVADPYACQACPNPLMNMVLSGAAAGDLECMCPSGYTVTGVPAYGALDCLPTADVEDIVDNYNADSAAAVEYWNLKGGAETIQSVALRHHYTKAAVGCTAFSSAADVQHCQTLANLCVLHNYNAESSPCLLYSALTNDRDENVHEQENWAVTLPWLYYSEEFDSTERALKTRVTFDPRPGYLDRLTFVLSKYTVDGMWLGYERLDTQFFFCGSPAPTTAAGGGTSSSTEWLRFGHTFADGFECDLRTVLDQETVFYDLFILDGDEEDLLNPNDDDANDDYGRDDDDYDGASAANGGKAVLYPVPVRNDELRDDNGGAPNRNRKFEDESNDVYTRRFFLLDTVSGVTANTDGGEGDALAPSFVRYASSIRLVVTVDMDQPEKLLSPVLEIKYKEREVTDKFHKGDDSVDTVTFEVEYTMDSTEFWSVVEGFMYAVSIITGVLWMNRVYNWQSRKQRLGAGQGGGQQQDYGVIDIPYLFGVCRLLVHTFAIVFFWFVFLLSAYWFTFFKLQATVFTLLPSQNSSYGENTSYHVFELFIILLFFAQVSVVLYHIHRQCTAEVFFVDWERAKAGGGRQGQGNNQSISAWRTILVANEWNKLQSTRRTSLEFTLVLVAFFLLGLDLQYSATAQPDLDDRSPGPINTVLRFCNTTWWYLLVTLAQFLYQWLIYERLFGDFVAQKFIDLCTIAKVSVIAMDEAYHGFYLHCDSPHANADDSMATLTQQLLLEENSERTARGLDPQNAPHLQTFELFASARWRLMWETYYVRAVGGGGGGGRGNSQFGGPRGGPGGGGGPNGGPNGGGGGPGVIEQMISGGQREVRRQMLQQRHSKAAAVEKVKQFLQEFFKKNLKNRDLDWKIVHPDGYQRVLDRPPMEVTSGMSESVLYPDEMFRWTQMLFLGIEYDLLIMNILTHAVFDIWTGNVAVALLMTYLVNGLFVTLRKRWGEINLANRTMIDDRFLM